MLSFGGDRAQCEAQRAGTQNGVGCARGERPGHPSRLGERDVGLDQRPAVGGCELVVDLESDGTGRPERQTALVGGEDDDLEGDIPAGDSALQSGSAAGVQVFAGRLVGAELRSAPSARTPQGR